MNFLAHFYCLPVPTNPLIVYGNLMPDISRGFSKQYNQFVKDGVDSKVPDIQSIDKGLSYHMEMDHIFHESEAFASFEAITKELLEERTSLPRIYIVAHVAVELMIDTYLLSIHPELGRSFYDTIAEVEDAAISNYIEYRKFDMEANKFIRNFRHFRQAEYLFQLKKMEGVAFALQQIFGNKLGLQIENNADLIEALQLAYNKIKDEIIPLLTEIKVQLK